MLGPASPGGDKPIEVTTPAGPDERQKALGKRPKPSGRAWLLRLVTGALLANLAAIVALAVLYFAFPQVRAWYHLRAARAELERYHNPQAVRHLQVCMRVWPEDADVLFLAARAARRARAYDEAEHLLAKYQQARGLNDAATFEQVLLSAERHVDRVDDLCWRYVEQDHPDTPLLLEALTRGYLRQYQLREARLCLDRWLQSQPDNPQARFLEGLFYLDYAHKHSEALAAYRRAVELDPEHEEARLGLAVSLVETSAFAEAAEHLEYLRQRQPDNLGVQVGLAECRNGMGDTAEAAQLVDGVLAQQPQYAPALSLRGRLALERGQYAEAETYLRQAVDRNPADNRSHYQLILCLHHNSKQAEAQRHQQQLRQMEEDLKRFDEIVTRDLLQRPRDPALHCTLGQLMLRGGMRQEGLRWLNSALRLDPQYAPARQALKKYYQEEAAKQHQQE